MEASEGAKALAEVTQAERQGTHRGLWSQPHPLCSPFLSTACPCLCFPRTALSVTHGHNATKATVECNSFSTQVPSAAGPFGAKLRAREK